MHNERRNDSIDFIKGIAIIAVVLYHYGADVLPYGYLGVDIFFVVSGFFLFKGLQKQFENNTFNYGQFILRKSIRLWPLIVIVSLFAMLFGYFLMLPDDYENLAESVIASSFFSNNILQCITTKNYWDISNLYKPLMHLWYVGVLMEAYVVVPLIALLVNKILQGSVKQTAIGLTAVSIFLFCMPIFSEAQKFYYLPFRLFEISAGGMLFTWKITLSSKMQKTISFFAFGSLLLLLCMRSEIINAKAMLVLTCVCTLAFIHFSENIKYGKLGVLIKAGAACGKRSYSIYLWHQVFIAILFYSFFPEQSAVSFVFLILLVVVVSLLSYRYIETPLVCAISNRKREYITIASTVVSVLLLCVYSFLIFNHAGVVRDVEELDVFKNNIHRGMHAEYCDRPYQWNKDFVDNGRKKILIFGNSFGRDWANILYEWDYAHDKLQISYVYVKNLLTADNAVKNNMRRIEDADVVFYAVGPKFNEVPKVVKESVSKEKLYIIGGKNFGTSNGIVYAQRNSKNYFKSSIKISDKLLYSNNRIQKEYGSHFVNMMAPIMIDSVNVGIFTDDHKFISQDCLHLTKAGALYYARILNIDDILNLKN